MLLNWSQSYGVHALKFHPCLPEIYVDWDEKNQGYKVSFYTYVLKNRFKTVEDAQKFGVRLAISELNKAVRTLKNHESLSALVESKQVRDGTRP